MLNPFKSTREKSLAAEITVLRVRRSDLGRQYTDADASVAAAVAALEDAHVRGDGDAVSKANTFLSSAERCVKGYLGAMSKLDAQITSKEAELAAHRDAEIRKGTIAELQVREKRFRAAHAGLMAALTEYSAASGGVAVVIPEAKQLEIFASALVRIEFEPYERLLPQLIANHIVAIQNGSAPAALPQAEAPAAKQIAPEPVATTRLFSLKGLHWTEQGMQRVHPAYAPLDLPDGLAQRALDMRVVIEITDPRVASLRRQHSPRNLHISECVSIDGSNNEVATGPRDEQIKHSAFAG